MTVNEMLSKMSSNELVEWMAFYNIEAAEKHGQMAQRQMINKMSGGRR